MKIEDYEWYKKEAVAKVKQALNWSSNLQVSVERETIYDNTYQLTVVINVGVLYSEDLKDILQLEDLQYISTYKWKNELHFVKRIDSKNALEKQIVWLHNKKLDLVYKYMLLNNNVEEQDKVRDEYDTVVFELKKLNRRLHLLESQQE